LELGKVATVVEGIYNIVLWKRNTLQQ